MADETILSKPDDAKAVVEKHFPEPVATTAVTHTELREFLVEFLEKILGEEPGKSEPERRPG